MAPPRSGNEAFLSILAAAQSGELEAQDRLFTDFYAQVEEMVHLGLARDLRSSRPWLLARFSTGDVVQEVFRSLLRDLSGFRGRTEDAFRGYLAMVVRNRLLDAIRYHEAAQRDGRRSSRRDGEDSGEDHDADPALRAMRVEELERFHDVLNSLEERARLLLRERTERGTNFEDLAVQLGFGSRDAARRAFYAAQAKLAIHIRRSADPDSDTHA